MTGPKQYKRRNTKNVQKINRHFELPWAYLAVLWAYILFAFFSDIILAEAIQLLRQKSMLKVKVLPQFVHQEPPQAHLKLMKKEIKKIRNI